MKRYEVVVYELETWPGDKKRREWRSTQLGAWVATVEGTATAEQLVTAVALEFPAPAPEVDRAR